MTVVQSLTVFYCIIQYVIAEDWRPCDGAVVRYKTRAYMEKKYGRIDLGDPC